MEYAIAMLTDRPYVLAFLASFLIVSGAERGWKRTLFWLVSGTFLGWLAEASSIRTGFPFGGYDYHDQLFPRELWLAGIPFFASISFSFTTYFGYSVACTFRSALRWTGSDLERIDDPLVTRAWQTLILAALITTWLDLATDPVAHLGRFWFLGDLYHYHDPGYHLDIPLTNYLGWVFTSLCIVFVNQRFDAWLSARGESPQGFRLPFRPLWAIGSVMGNFGFMLFITVSLFGVDGIPEDANLGAILASGLLLTGAFVAVTGWRLKAGLAKSVGQG